jgi:hypothetical protein
MQDTVLPFWATASLALPTLALSRLQLGRRPPKDMTLAPISNQTYLLCKDIGDLLDGASLSSLGIMSRGYASACQWMPLS